MERAADELNEAAIHSRPRGIPSERVVAVVASLDTGKVQVGSGYLLTRGVVLTARHCAVDKRTGRAARSLKIIVRSDGRSANAELSAAALDVAVLSVSGTRSWGEVQLDPPAFGRVDVSHSGELRGCEAVGFPLWQFDPRERYRHAAELHGTIRLTEGAESGLLVMRDPLLGDVAMPKTTLAEDRATESPWGGLSGALVFHCGVALGVIVEHHPRQGRSALTICPIASIAERAGQGDSAAVAVTAALGLSPGLDLPVVGSPREGARQRTAGKVIFQPPRPFRNDHFTGREDLLARLGAMRSGEPTVVLQAVTGLGGIGKTELVTEYAHRHQADYDLVFTIRAGTPATLSADLQNLANQAGLNQAWDGLTARVLRWLRSRRGWLLIFDDAEDLSRLAEYLPDGPGHVLITSRDRVWRQRAAVVEVDVWEPAESVEFLRSRLGARGNDERCDRQLAAMLEHFPLALEQAAGYMDATGTPCAEYIRLYQERGAEMLDECGPAVLGYDHTVAGAWGVTFRTVEKTQPRAIELLRLCAYLAPEALPEAIFANGAGSLPAELREVIGDRKAFNDTLGVLDRYRLIKRSDDGMLSMHRLVQHVVRIGAGEAGRDLAAASVRLLSAVFPEADSSGSSAPHQAASTLLPHALAAAAHAVAMGVEPDLATQLLARAGDYMGRRARLAGAEASVTDAVAITSQIYGHDTPEMARSLTTLGRLLLAKEGLAAARACFERALAITEGAYGPGSIEGAELLNDLAATLMQQGDISGAQAFLRQTGHLTDLGVGRGTGGEQGQVD